MSAKRAAAPGRRESWHDKHLRSCVCCGRVWKPRRRKTCPDCGADRSICLTCDIVWAEEDARRRRCAQPEQGLRELAKACGGHWEWAQRALDRAGGNPMRAVLAIRTNEEPRRRRSPNPGHPSERPESPCTALEGSDVLIHRP